MTLTCHRVDMMNTNSVNADAVSTRPIVFVAISDRCARATHAYVLSAAGFDVVMPAATGETLSARPPDIVLIDLADLRDDSHRRPQSSIRDLLGKVPIVALVPDVGRSSCELASRLGCAAVCVATCSAEVLAAGLRAVLERSRGQTVP